MLKKYIDGFPMSPGLVLEVEGESSAVGVVREVHVQAMRAPHLLGLGLGLGSGLGLCMVALPNIAAIA